MRITVEVEEDEILKGFNADEIVEHFDHKRDVDELLKAIGTTAIIRYLREYEPVHFILDEMAEVRGVEEHVADCKRWLEIQKKAVG